MNRGDPFGGASIDACVLYLVGQMGMKSYTLEYSNKATEEENRAAASDWSDVFNWLVFRANGAKNSSKMR